MNKEIQSIIEDLQNAISGNSWYGRTVNEILGEVNPATAATKPGKGGHSLLDLLYHLVTWSEFTLRRIRGDKEQDLAAFEKLDWREIDPAVHTWAKGLAALKKAHEEIISVLQQKDDALLEKTVEYRDYNFRFLLHGLVQHNIYHIGQVAYVSKFLV